MKKIFLSCLIILFSVTCNAQTGVALASKQTTQIVRADTANARLSRIISATSALTVQVISSVTSTVNLNSSAFGSAGYKWISVQFIATSLDAADGVIKLQDSNDGTNWNDISGASITVASGTSSNMIRYTAFTTSNCRAVWTKGSNTAGTIAAIAVLKQ